MFIKILLISFILILGAVNFINKRTRIYNSLLFLLISIYLCMLPYDIIMSRETVAIHFLLLGYMVLSLAKVFFKNLLY